MREWTVIRSHTVFRLLRRALTDKVKIIDELVREGPRCEVYSLLVIAFDQGT